MSEDNKAIVRELVEEGYNKNNLSVVEENHAHDFVLHWIQHDPAVAEERGPDALSSLQDSGTAWHRTVDG